MKYKSRAHQIRSFVRQYKNGEISLAVLLRDTSFVAAVEERHRALRLLSDPALHPDCMKIYNKITSEGVLSVLGYSTVDPK